MSKDQISINSAITRELHQLLNQDDMTFIENQFQVKQVLHNGVTKDEFEEIIFDKLPTKVTISSAKLNNIFTKIDAYSTGLINWNGFLTYVLTSLQRDKTATLGNDRALHTEFRVLKGPNNSVILRIDIMPLFDAKTGEIMYSTCRFVTASKDGILAVWTQKWKLQKYKICRDGGSDIVKRKVFPFILDMVCLPNMQMIATCSTDDSIRFYDINNSKMDLLMKLSGIESIATCLDFWFDLNNNEYSILTIGDSAGGVLILEFYKSITERLLGLHGFGTPVIKLSDILQKQNQYIDGTYSPNQHDEWVRKVKYISEFKSILSCAISSTLSMVIFSIVNESEKKIFNVPKGISCFDYSSHHSIIVSGSIDRNLRIWNPHINKKPIATLSGHSAPLIQVIIVDDQFISISLSEDKSIKIWDLTERVCLQTVYDRALKWGNQPVSSAIHDPYHRLLLLGSNKLVVYKRIWQPQTDDRIIFTSHEHPLTGIAYSSLYNYLISSGDNGKIVYWDLETGQRRVQIVQSHAIIVDGNEVPTLITAMSLDGTNSRLFTAGGDGLLKMWLLSNGSFLKSIHIPEGKDINSILVCKMHIFFGGWSRRVNVCHEELHIETLKTWALYHTDDIMEICHIQPNKIATASWDGKIVIWMLETGQMLSIWSLHNEFHFYYMPELKTVAAAQLTEYNFLDFVSLSAAYQKKCVKCHSLEEKCLVHSVLKIQKRKIKHSEFEQLNPSSTEINFPALYCMVTLPTRLQKPSIGNLFVGDTYGFIQLWSVGPKGGFIALFSNVSLLDQYTYCMTTDDENKYLFTGDTSGFIRVWYIKYFYSGENQPSSDELNVETTPFPFSTKRLQLVKERVLRELKILKPKLYFKFATVDAPHLISSFRGHLKPIVKIIVLQKKQVILTASKDKSVRIWTYSGAYLRTLGDTREFSLDLVLSAPIGPMNRKAPADVTKVASGPTLQVIYQGMSPNWYRLREVILRTYIKSLRRKRIENILLKSLSDLRQEDQVKKSRVSVMERRQAQKIKFSQMGAPLGKFYAFKEKRKDNSALPSIPNTYKTMNCVYAYLRNPPLAALSLEAAYKYLDSHRHAARLIMSKSMYEHKTLFRNSVNSATKVSNELHELLTEDDLSVVETQFQVKQVLRHGITVEEFVEIILDTIPTKVGMSTEKIGSVFAKIDVHSTGLIDWNAFISYILTSLQRDKAATLSTDKSLQTTFRVLNGPNRDIIMRIDMMPQIDEKTGEMIYSTCRFVTASRDGVLAVWTQKWNLQKFKVCRENFSEITRRKVFPWILDMVCLPNVQMIATCSTDDRIRFYDSTNAGMDLIFALIEFEAIATCLDFWFDLNNNEHSFLIIGDSKGGVLFLEFYKSLSEKLFGLHGYGTNFVKLSDIFKKQNKFVKGTYYSKQHDEWVRKVKYINELKSIFSCSISSTKSMLVFGVLLETGHKVFVVEKGISSFDYSSRHNIIVSGSIDRCLRIWNPYVNKKPVATLTGHSAPVLHVMIIDEQFLCISLSEDKCIKVWDLKEQSCVQTIFDRAFKWGNQKVYSAMYDPFHRQLLLGSMKLIVFEQVWQAETTDKTIFTTHTHPLLGVVYSNVYNYVISASEIGKVIFWDLESGEKKVQISLTHTQIVDGIEVQMAITAMSLDGNSRRLFTAGGDGFLKMWSMTNGSFLKSIHLPEGKDINSIIACKNRIFFGGWTKRVYVCNEELHLETMRTWAVQHTDDIMEICHILPDYISTASWDGKIVMWMLETGQALSVWSLHHQFLFNYMPKLQTLVQLKFIESQTLDFLAAELDRDSDQFENAEHLMASVKTKMRKKAQGSHSTRDYLRSEISFPALNCMVTLTTRYDKPPVGNLFVADTDGFIQLWSVSRQGGLISLFANVSVIENYTSCMTIDAAEKYLFTGDTIGYIRVWYIKYYYSGESQPPLDKLNIETRPFPFSSKRLQPVRERVLKELTILKPKKHLAFANFNCPHLISSFRGHLKSIVKITILEKKKLILSASKDKSVRIWTYSGAYLRTIGDSRQWSLELALSTPVLPMDRKVPMDISRVASGPTLQVILQGVSPQWYRTREIILCTYVKSVRRKIDTPLPTVNVKDEEVRLRSEAERKHALEMKFSKMGSPLGEYFAFKPYERDKPSLPTVPDIFKEMNCVYAYLECQPPCTISLEPAHKYLESHRYSTRLKMSKSTYEHAKVVL